MIRQRGEDGGKPAEALRETQNLGGAVTVRNRFRKPGSARRNSVDIVAGDRLGGANEPQHETADGAGPAGRPFRQLGKRAKQRSEAPEPLPVFRDGWVKTHGPPLLVRAKYAAGPKGRGWNKFGGREMRCGIRGEAEEGAGIGPRGWRVAQAGWRGDVEGSSSSGLTRGSMLER